MDAAWWLLPVWIVIALGMTYPLYRNLSGISVPGADTIEFAWIVWWVKYSILQLHQSPFVTSYMFAPHHVPLVSISPLLTIMAGIPLQTIAGIYGAMNLMLIGSAVACCLAAFLLIRDQTGSVAGAFVGCLVFSFAAYRFANLNSGHPSTFFNWALPLFILFLLRWLRGRRVRDAALAGLFLGFEGLMDLNQFSLALLFGVLVVPVYWCIHQRHNLTSAVLWQWFRGVLAMGAVSAVLMLPVLLSLGGTLGSVTATALSGANNFAPDLLGYFVPSFHHPIWGQFGAQVADRFQYHDNPKVVYLGLAALALALVALAGRRDATSRRWAALSGVFFLLSLGPLLHVAGTDHPVIDGMQFAVPLPFMLLHQLPIFSGILVPSYFTSFVSLGLSVLAGLGVAWLLRGLRRPLQALAAMLLAGLILLDSLAAPLRIEPTPPTDPFYYQLRAQPSDLALLEEPLGWQMETGGRGTWDPRQLLWATVAQRPLVSGYVPRGSDAWLDDYSNNSVLSVLVAPEGTPAPESRDRAAVLAALSAMHVGYIVVHRFPYYEQVVTYVRNTLGLTPSYEDSELTAFPLP